MPSFIASITPSYDTDASAFFNTAGVSKTDAKQQISRFVTGIKDLGLWSSMVCWPLRSSQNAGTGTIAYSLGGLGTFNGTLRNGPTWGADGLTYDGFDDNITTSFTLAATQLFYGMIGPMPTSGNNGNFFGAPNSNSQGLYWLNPRSGFGGEYRYAGSNLAVADNTTSGVNMWSVIAGAGLNTKGFRSKTLLGTAGSVAPTPSPLTLSSGLSLGRYNGGYQGTASFVFVIHSTQTSPDAFYDLYKTTLGLGLDLP